MNIYKKNKLVKGQVTGIEKYGIFINIDQYYSGLIHISEISEGFVKNINDYVKIGETIFAKIVDVDDENCQLKLSIKNINYKVRKKFPLIVETTLGFKPLADNLKKWISEYKKRND